jgi:hypothetical protein
MPARQLFAAAVSGVLGLTAGLSAGAARSPMQDACAPFVKAVQDYAALHRHVARELPKLPTRAQAEAIGAHRKALADGIMKARGVAHTGDIFAADSGPALRERLRQAVAQGPKGKRKEMATGNPVSEGVAVDLRANAPYPEGAPWSNVPMLVLAVLPKLPPEVEYRFVGDNLVLLDVEANLIVDFLPNATATAPLRYKP